MDSLKVCRKSSCPLWTEWRSLAFLPANRKSKPALWMTMGRAVSAFWTVCKRCQGTDALYRWALVFFSLAGIWSKLSMCPSGFEDARVHDMIRLATGTFKPHHVFYMILRHCYVHRDILVKTLRVRAPIWVALSMGHHSHFPWWLEGRQDYISLRCASLNNLRFIEVVSPSPGCPFTLLICSVALIDWPLPEGIEKRPCPSFIIFSFFFLLASVLQSPWE